MRDSSASKRRSSSASSARCCSAGFGAAGCRRRPRAGVRSRGAGRAAGAPGRAPAPGTTRGMLPLPPAGRPDAGPPGRLGGRLGGGLIVVRPVASDRSVTILRYAMRSQEVADPRRRLPSVDRVLASPEVQRLVELYGRGLVTVQAQAALVALRATAADLGADDISTAALAARIAGGIEAALGPPLRRVLNATGVLLHTNLGRAPLPRAVADALPPLLDAACDLEMSLVSGRRGERNARTEHLLRLLTG